MFPAETVARRGASSPSQSPLVTALPKGEPLAWRYSFRLNCKVCGFARASPFGRGGIALAMTERASPLLSGEPLPSSPAAMPPSPRGRLQAMPQSFWFRQRLPPRGSCQSRQALTEGVKLPLRGSWHRAAMTERVKPSPWGRWLRPTGADGRGAPPERARTLPGYSFVPNSTFWGENRKRLSKVHKKAAQSLAGAGLTVPGRIFSRNNRAN